MTSSPYEEMIEKVKTALDNIFAKKTDVPKVFYGTCTTSASAQIKEITTSSNYILVTGTILIVKFTNGQTYNSSSTNTLQLKINNNANIDVEYVIGQKGIRYHWAPGEIVQFVYDGSNFIMIDEGAATTTYWGVTKLYDGVDSTSTSVAATPNSVKIAYDLANGREDPNNKVTSWSNTTTDTNYPSEKLVKDSLDEKQSTLVSGTNIKTINNNSLVGSGNVNLSIPSSSSDLSDGSALVKTSNTTGLLKNNGEVMTSGTGASNWAVGNHTHSAYVNPTIADNLTTNDSTQVLSAKQGKVLADLIGDAITYINQ